MKSEPVLDLEPLLAPIDGASPSGRSLAYEPEYDQLRAARRSGDEAPQGDWQRETQVARWDEVFELGTRCLQSRSKDLQIAAWVTEALTHLHGFPGIRDGFRLLRELTDRFWDTLFPELDDGDVEVRCGPIEFLNAEGVLPLMIRRIPLTDVYGDKRYSYLIWQESRALDNLAKSDAEKAAAAISEGKIASVEFDKAVGQTPRPYYDALMADLDAATAAYRELDAVLDARFGRDAPSLANVRKAFDEVRRVLEPIVRAKRQAEPAAESEPETADEEPSGDGEQAEAEPAGGDGPEPVRRARPVARRRTTGGPIADADDARERILEAARFLRQHEPTGPAAFLVVRALRLGELYGLGRPPEPSGLASPASETRQELKRLASEGDWPALLEAAEEALGRPEGRAWLDPQRYAVQAMAACADVDRAAALDAVKALVRAMLADFPDLPDRELADDTPTANTDTRAWLDAEVIVAAPEPVREEPTYVPPPEPIDRMADASAEPDAWDLAVEELNAGRASDAVQRLRRALNAATCGRDRFRRKLQLAELCLMAGGLRVALPLLDDLARQIDEFRLEQWEDESLCARVWGALYRCLKGLGAKEGSAERLRTVYDRLCRLDVGQAMSFGDS